MGTRNLTMVIKGGKTRVAQYGQWDGYPSGQGLTCLEFLHGVSLPHFYSQLDKCRFVDDSKQAEIDAYLKSIGVVDEWMNMEQSRKYKQAYPQFSRDNGANILNYINNSDEHVIWLYDQSDFANDSLMNEWSYVIDFDKQAFEVYTGFNKEQLNPEERFYTGKDSDRGYYPIKLLMACPLVTLPSKEEFLKLESVESE